MTSNVRPLRRASEASEPNGSPGREALVTPPVCLTDETAAPFFIDWVSMSQVHSEGGLPQVDSGCVWAADEDGAIEWRTLKAVKHEGSFETSVNVRCDGFRVTFSGNASRFGRSDNLFGYGWRECVKRINAILAFYGLPPFTAGEAVQKPNGRGYIETRWTGARFSRLDLTANYEAGSAEAASLVMQYLGAQHAGRKSGRVLAAGETVDWGSGSRRQYWKAYVKALELKRHKCLDERLIQHCESRGIVRFEGTVRSNALVELQCAFLGEYERGFAMGQLVKLFDEHREVMTRATRSTDDLDALPKHLRASARDYLAGMDMARELSRATFYRHRNDLLSYGIDIAMRNVSPFTPRVRVVELTRAEMPAWYQLAA